MSNLFITLILIAAATVLNQNNRNSRTLGDKNDKKQGDIILYIRKGKNYRR